VGAGTLAYQSSEHFARRIDGFLSSEIDPLTQIGFATNAIREGGFFGVGVGEGQVKWSLPDAHTDFIIAVAAEEYGLVLVLVIIALYTTDRDPLARAADARARSVHPARGHGARLHLRHPGADQHVGRRSGSCRRRG
jgi:hypothetical protein